MVKETLGYKAGSSFIILKNRIQPIPLKYQKGLVKFSNNPMNKIHGLDKLNSIKVS